MSSAVPNTANDVKYLADIHVNSIEVQLDTRLFSQRYNMNHEDAWTHQMEWLNMIMDECKKYNITVIISISQFPRNPKLGLTQESPEFWDDPVRRNEVIMIAGDLAKRFSKRGPELGGYEILNEPVVRRKGKPYFPDTWHELMTDVIKEIRKYDRSRYVVVNPVLGAMPNQYDKGNPLDDPFLIYGAHMYSPHAFTHQGIAKWPRGVKYPGFASFEYWDKAKIEKSMLPLVEFQKKYKVLVWVGEFSAVRWAEGSNQYVKDLIELFDSMGWGWAYFQYKSYHGWAPDYDSSYSTDEKDDWKKHLIGRNTPRWNLLREAYKKNIHDK